ncbi:unnamed protein product [Sympodiomycopsis kandeliae]
MLPGLGSSARLQSHADSPRPEEDSVSGAKACLQFLPPEVLDRIAFYSNSFYSPHPPSQGHEFLAVNLPSLLLTCRRFHKYLNPKHNPNLYARLFATRFDRDPIARRYGPQAVEPRALVREFKRRCRIMKRMRYAVQIGRLRPEGNTEQAYENMRENLWLGYLMLTENDGLNRIALQWASLRPYYHLYHGQEMLTAALQPGYPPDSEERALALHINYLTTDPAELAVEDKDDALERLFVLRPFVFASHKFDCFFAPWTLRALPISDTSKAREEHLSGLNPAETQSFLATHRPNQGESVEPPQEDEQQAPDSSRRNPFLADLTPRSKATYVEHCGRKLRMCAPLATHAAYLSFFMQVEKDPDAGGLVALTGAGVEPGTADRRANAPPRPPIQLGLLAPELGGGPNGVTIESLPREARGPLALTSRDHDADMTRLFACYDPFLGPGLKPTFHAGTFDGAWEGRFCFFDFDSYREMLSGQMRSLYTGPFGEQPQVWKLKEHFVKVGTGRNPKRGGTGSVITAGFDPEAPIEELTSQPTTLAEAKELARERGGGKREAGEDVKAGRSKPKGIQNVKLSVEEDDGAGDVPVVYDSDDDGLPEDLDLYPQFSAEDGGPSAGHGYLPPGLSGISGQSTGKSGASTEEITDSDEDDSQYEMLLSGEGHSAWGRFYLRGRVRAWDGMVILTKEYRPDGRGRWLYRGYVTNQKKFIGRWRDSFTPGDMSGYEGPFILTKRREEDDDGEEDADT